jgi:glycosyltransferase involved in cell wall biosynthesis
MPESIRSLRSDVVEPVGQAPDLAAYFRVTRVFVAPLRYGAGMKGKVGQSLSWGVPVVTTSIGSEGMGLAHGEHVLIADTPNEFAVAVLRLCADDGLWQNLSDAGAAFVRKQFSREAARARLAALLPPPSDRS